MFAIRFSESITLIEFTVMSEGLVEGNRGGS